MSLTAWLSIKLDRIKVNQYSISRPLISIYLLTDFTLDPYRMRYFQPEKVCR